MKLFQLSELPNTKAE